MPTGPKGQKRPADAIGNAMKVMRIATGEGAEDFDPEKAGKNEAAAEMRRKGAAARSAAMSPAMAACVSDRLLSMEDVAALVEAAMPAAGKRGPNKKKA